MAGSKKSSAKKTAAKVGTRTRNNDKARSNSNKTDTPVLLSDILPLPERKFVGRIGTYYTDSEAEVPEMASAPAGAPNVLLVLLDDVGFGHTSTFGGPVNTPTL